MTIGSRKNITLWHVFSTDIYEKQGRPQWGAPHAHLDNVVKFFYDVI